MKHSLLAIFIVVFISGCALTAQKEPVRVVVENQVRTTVVDDQRFSNGSTPLQSAIGNAQPVFGQPVREMARQLEIGLKDKGIKTLPIAITPFVDLNKPKEDHPMGVELAEGFFHELQVRGFNVVDYQALPFKKGQQKTIEFLPDFYRQYRISYVVTGTYIITPDGALLNARVLDTVSQQVVATGQSKLSTADLEGGLPGYNPMSGRDGMIIENGGVPVN